MSTSADSNVAPETDVVETEEPTVVVADETVGVVRSVRFGRVIIGGSVLGVVIAVIITLSYPVLGSDYTMAQAVGFMALIGAALGLGAGAVFALILARFAAKRHGTALAKRSDVG
jgi:hypothetical protein